MVDVTMNLHNYLKSLDYESDVTLVAQGQEFPAHRFILSFYSPVLKRMLETEMQKTVKDAVEIEDIKPEILNEMLQVIYTGKFMEKPDEMSVEMVKELWKAAHKYEMKRLIGECAYQIHKTITKDNAVEWYTFGKTNNAPPIMKSAIYKINENKKEIFKDAETLLEITTAYPDLVFKIMFP